MLNSREIYPSLVYNRGLSRLALGNGLSVWANHIGTVIYWGVDPEQAPAGQMPADDLPEVAHRLAEQVYATSATP